MQHDLAYLQRAMTAKSQLNKVRFLPQTSSAHKVQETSSSLFSLLHKEIKSSKDDDKRVRVFLENHWAGNVVDDFKALMLWQGFHNKAEWKGTKVFEFDCLQRNAKSKAFMKMVVDFNFEHNDSRKSKTVSLKEREKLVVFRFFTDWTFLPAWKLGLPSVSS